MSPLEVAKPRTRLASTDQKVIVAAIRADAAAHDGVCDPNRVRVALADLLAEKGKPFARLLSATYSGLAAQGRLESLGFVGINDDLAGGNRGKPQRNWRWVA